MPSSDGLAAFLGGGVGQHGAIDHIERVKSRGVVYDGQGEVEPIPLAQLGVWWSVAPETMVGGCVDRWNLALSLSRFGGRFVPPTLQA